jgi:CBS domain-containing protein
MGVENTAVKNVMSKSLVTISPSASMLDAINLMNQKKIDRLIIIDRETAVGIVTKKDIIRFTSSDVSGQTLDKIRISECMTDSLVTENEKASVSDVVKSMLEYDISSVIITNKSDNLTGIVTKIDIVKFYGERITRKYRVKECMSSPAITIQPANSIYYAAELMTKNKISRLVVMESSLVGIITMNDFASVSPLLLAKIYSKDQTFFMGTDYVIPTVMFPHLTVADIMKTNVITVRSEADSAEGASLMIKHEISGLPVLNDSLELVGVLTKTDICKALSRMTAN